MVLYNNIFCFISDFRSVVNFNYVSSPEFVPNQKGFIISAASVSRFWSCHSFWSFSTSPSDGQTRLLALWKQIQNSSCRQVVYSKIIIFATLSTLWCPFASPFWNRPTCINPTSRRPIESRTAPFATVAIIAIIREWLIIWNCFRWVAQYT